MESLKNVVGLGNATTTTANNETGGREPVNGVTGAGTADQPYDAGNSEDSHLTAGDGNELAAPLKSFAEDQPETAPTGGILASLASAVGLGGSNTTTDRTLAEQQGQEPVSGITGQGTADQPYDVGNQDDPSLGGKGPHQTNAALDPSPLDESRQTAHTAPMGNGTGDEDPASTNQGLQFIGGADTANTAVSHDAGQQTHASITQAVNEGALCGDGDPAQSNKGLAFVSTEQDKHTIEPLMSKTSNHEPVTGTSGAYTMGQPLGTTEDKIVEPASGSHSVGNSNSNIASFEPPSTSNAPKEISNPVTSGPDTTYNPEPLDKDGDKADNTGPAFLSTLFSNPFTKRESVSGASGETDMDPKAKAPPGSEPITELQDHVVPIMTAKEKRPFPTQSSPSQPSLATNKPESIVVEPKDDGSTRPPNHLGPNVPPGAASPKREKGKGKVYGDTDSNSTRSSLTRNESIATSQTGPSTLDSRRFSSHTPGKIPTAGGIVLGERAAKDRERRASMAPSSHSAVTSEPHYAGRESLQKVTEDAERAPVTQHLPSVTQTETSPQPAAPLPSTQTAVTLPKASTDATRMSTSARVPGTEKGSLESPPPTVANTSRFSEQGIRDSPSPSEPATSAAAAAAERKPSLVSRIGRKLSIKSSPKHSRSSASTPHPETISEKK